MENDKFLIVDGNNLLYSSYHVCQKLLSSSSELSLSFIFLKVIFSILKKNSYRYLLIIFDGGGNNFRKEIYRLYKLNRPKMPENLFNQMNEIKSLLEEIGIRWLQIVDHEADDIIASFIERFKNLYPNIFFTVFTRDKDLLQLIDEKIDVMKYIGKKITLYSKSDFFRDYNFEPKNYPDYLSILGDRSDNIKGINGIGPVNSKKIIERFGSIDKIYESIEEVPNNLRELLRGNENLLNINKVLITLKRDINLPDNLSRENCQINFEKLKQYEAFKKLSF